MAVISIDLTNAFDNLSHQKPLLTLQDYRSGKSALSWFHDYLSSRMQRVAAHSTHSPFFLCDKRVPQGSVFVQFLLNLYIANLPTLTLSCNATLPSFVDERKTKLPSRHLQVAVRCLAKLMLILVYHKIFKAMEKSFKPWKKYHLWELHFQLVHSECQRVSTCVLPGATCYSYQQHATSKISGTVLSETG